MNLLESRMSNHFKRLLYFEEQTMLQMHKVKKLNRKSKLKLHAVIIMCKL